MCDDLTHEQLKRNAWDTCTPIGVQDAFDGRGTKLDMRNAPCCGTTLCKPIHLALCMDDIEAKEREIAEREGVDYDRCRVYLRERAIRELRAEAER